MGSSLSRIQAIIYDRDFPRFPRPDDGRADKDSYPHDRRADKDSYPHDRRADKDSYPHDRHNQSKLIMVIVYHR